MNRPLNPTSYPTSAEQTRIKFEEKMNRLFLAVGVKNDSELARFLGITPQSVGPARKKLQIPSSWIEKIAETTSISSDWLFFGRGPMRPGEVAQPAANAPQQPEAQQETATCARCTKLEVELEEERKERRELAQENRQLLRENGDLKAKCATLEERQKHCCPESQVFEKLPNIPPSKADLRA